MDNKYLNVLKILRQLNVKYFGESVQETETNSIEISIATELFEYMKESLLIEDIEIIAKYP